MTIFCLNEHSNASDQDVHCLEHQGHSYASQHGEFDEVVTLFSLP